MKSIGYNLSQHYYETRSNIPTGKVCMNKILENAHSCLAFLRVHCSKLKNIIPQSQLCSVFHAIVEIHLRYADVIWGSLSKTKLDTLQRLHNRAHAIIENARIKDEWSSNWLSVENLIRFDRSVMAYKILNKLSPESLWDKYQYRSAYSNYETRNCKDLQIPRLKTDHAKKGFYYSALKAWNDIPANIREIQTLGRFKKELKAHLTS